jgi:hypothetical protein
MERIVPGVVESNNPELRRKYAAYWQMVMA